jgi:hypothetical protein
MSNSAFTLEKTILFWRCVLATIFTGTLLIYPLSNQPAKAQLKQYCQLSPAAAQAKEDLRLAAIKGNQDAKNRYQQLVKQHGQELQNCRDRTWPQVQAVWLRLYPCDIQPGAIEQVMDRIVNRGYNQVYLEVFYDGQVLLPAANNPTVWPSAIRTPGAENIDLMATAIQKGRERGLKVYAWMFTKNFGYTYALRPDRQDAIARNGKGQTSLEVTDNNSQVFVDPYNLEAKQDFYQMVQEVVRRKPDGVLFDYVRYPRQEGPDSVATRVSDLWLFSPATQAALLRRAQNNKGLELIRRFIARGYITAGDINELDQLHTDETEPMWQGRIPQPVETESRPSASQRQPLLQWQLWQLAVAHAMQGILDFVSLAAYPAQQQRIPAGVVFFPDGNQTIGQGYDSRLQPWDRFPNSLEWHPMSYATCGTASCIVQQVQRVLDAAPPGTKVIPALAGTWGSSMSNRPSLEVQMEALRQFAPQLAGVSHFAYSWLYPEHDKDRKFCRVPSQ